MIYGFHAVLARLKQNPASIKQLFLDERRAQKTHDSRVQSALDCAAAAKITPKIVDFKTLKNIENLRHQGIVATIAADQKALTLWDILDSADSFISDNFEKPADSNDFSKKANFADSSDSYDSADSADSADSVDSTDSADSAKTARFSDSADSCDSSDSADPEKPLILLVLDGVTDPRNLGACLRAADGAGAAAVIASKDRAAPLNEIAIKTASGAAESVPYIVVTNLVTALQDMQEAGVTVVGLADSAKDDLYKTTLPRKIAFVLGSEGKGLRQRTQKNCDLLLKIPMHGTVESLNVSTAAALCLFESRRQFSTQNPR